MTILLTLLLACSGDDTEPIPANIDVPTPDRQTSCDPLEPEICGFPWPSSYFQADDKTTDSGVRMNLAEDTLPRHFFNDEQVKPGFLGHVDGASTLTPVLTFFPDVVATGTISVADIGAYADADAKTVILDTTTNERVPHFVELDAHAPEGEKTLFLRPVVPLNHATRYVVGIRNLKTASGGLVPSSEAFNALRDSTASDDDAIWRQPYMDAHVFPALADDGFTRDELQIAWDFTTGSIDGTIGDMVFMRDDALKRAGPNGPPYTLDEVTDGDCAAEGATIARTVKGHFTIPRYTESDEPPTRLLRDADGQPMVAGDTEAEFLIRIPCSVAADPGDGAPVLVYGHGLLGDLSEANTGHLSRFAHERGHVIFAMTWIGMSERDAFALPILLGTDLSDFPAVPERSMQGLVNKLTGLRSVRGAMASDPALAFDGKSVIGADVGYYGISQGGIIGGAYMALSTDIERGVFGVGGMPYSLLLDRSEDFGVFGELMRAQFPDPREFALLVAGLQSAWDVGEGSGYANVMTSNPLPGTPPKRILMQVAIGDVQVSTLAAHIGARAYGASTITPTSRPVWGIDEVSAPHAGSALVEWDFGAEPEPLENIPPSGFDTHECPRQEPAAQEQADLFLRTGIVEQTCDGICASACD